MDEESPRDRSTNVANAASQYDQSEEPDNAPPVRSRPSQCSKFSEREEHLMESYFPGSTARRKIASERSDRFSQLSIQHAMQFESHAMQNALPPLLVLFACFIAAILGLVVAGLHDLIKYVGCPLGINGCNSFAGESYEKKGYILLKYFDEVPQDVIHIVMATLCAAIIGLIADVVPASYAKQVLGGGTVQSLLSVAAGVPIPFRCALLRVVVTAVYFLGGGTMGGDGPTIQVCTSVASMIGWSIGIRAARTQSLLASLGFCCGFAASFNAPLSGMLFAMEELQHISGRLTTRVICVILIGSIVSTAVMRAFNGNKVLFEATHPSNLEEMVSGGSTNTVVGQDMWMLISFLIGLMTALVGYAFSVAFHYTHKFLDGSVLPRLRRFIVFGMGGFLVASVGSGIFRATGLRGIWGIGLNSLAKNLDQDFEGHAGYLLLFAIGKLVAFCLSVSLRFPGDTLEPVLIAGAFLGAAVGRHLPTDVVGDSNAPCVIFGMVGLFASCFRFPLTPIVIVLELTGTGTYNLILPVAIASFTALAVSNHMFPPILEQILHQDHIDLEAVADLAELEEEIEAEEQVQRKQSASAIKSEMSAVSIGTAVSTTSHSRLGQLKCKLEESLVEVSTRRRRSSIASSMASMASSRGGPVSYLSSEPSEGRMSPHSPRGHKSRLKARHSPEEGNTRQSSAEASQDGHMQQVPVEHPEPGETWTL